MTSKPTQEGQHGYQAACDPQENNCHFGTFSISFFRWEKKAKKGIKKGKSFMRLTARADQRQTAFEQAEIIVRQLNDGWAPEKKGYKLQ